MNLLNALKEFFFLAPIVIPKRTRQELIRFIENHQTVANLLINTRNSYEGMMKEQKLQKKFLSEYEMEFINLLEDDFEKAVAEAAIANEFGLPEFFKEGADLNSVIYGEFERIALYLDPKHPLNFAKVQKPGKEILFWLLSFNINRPEEKPDYVYKLISEAILSGVVAERDIDKETVQNFVSIFGIVAMSGEYAKQFNFLLRIVRKHFLRLQEIVNSKEPQ